MAENRRLAAIMAVDVVGYSRLMGENEAGTLRAVRERQKAALPFVRDSGGRIVKTMGDGLLLEFPSVVAAVECAICIQALMAERNLGVDEAKRIVYRIGVHIGDIITQDDDILGEGVNIAARLEGACEAGGVCLSEDAHRQVRGKVGVEFADLGVRVLKNIAQPVRLFGLTPQAIPPAHPAAPKSETPAADKPSAPRLSVVVLPFANMGGGAEHQHFVDGVTESLTTDLARIRGVRVIGRSTAFTYKDKAVDLKQIGEDLNVRYVLEGSVQRGGERIRVNVQLIDAESGCHLWAERFDKPFSDLFVMQDEIVARLKNALDAQVIYAEAQRAKRSLKPEAIDRLFQAYALMLQGFTPQNLAKARVLYSEALAFDNDDVDALTGVASVDIAIATTFAPENREALLAAAEETLVKALSFAPESAYSHCLLGTVLVHTNRAALGIREFERALELDRNLAQAHAQLGFAKIMLGRPEETEAHIYEALRLSPQDAFTYLWYFNAGLAKLTLGKLQESEIWLRRSVETNPNFPLSHFVLACVLVYLRRLPEARSEASIGRAINPGYTLSRVRASAPKENSALANVERFIEGLRLAGVPEA